MSRARASAIRWSTSFAIRRISVQILDRLSGFLAQSVTQIDREAGIRLPDISVPLATYTGWNMRHPDIGGVGQTLSLIGSTLPFPATRAERQASPQPTSLRLMEVSAWVAPR